MQRTIFLLFFTLLSVLPTLAPAETKPGSYVRVEIFANATELLPGDRFQIVLKQNIAPHWHTYWKNAGDSGLPLTVEWEDDFEISEWRWSTPEIIEMPPLINYGFEGEAYMIADITVPDDFNENMFVLKGRADWLVCQEICIPESQHIMAMIPIGENGQNAHEDIFQRASKTLPQPLELKGSNIKDDTFQILYDVCENHDCPAKIFLFANSNNLVSTQAFGSPLKDRIAFPLTENWAPTSTLSGVLKINDIGYEVTLDIEEGLIPPNKIQNNAYVQISIWTALASAFLGGLILNLMPCVFPILSLKAFSLLKLGNGQRREAQMSGLAYTSGILITFALLAGLLIILKSSAQGVGWGFQLQNPFVILGIIWLLFLLTLNFAGLFEIPGISVSRTPGDGVKGSFFTGILTTIVATPCTAPFMASALGYALFQPPLIAMVIFLVLGLGLAFPYLLISFSGTARKILPKPGAWMERVKEFLAFPMAATAIYFTWVLTNQVGSAALVTALTGVLALILIIWSFKHFAALGRTIFTAIAALTLAISLPFILPNNTPQAVPYSQSALHDLLQTNHGVFVNMTADWCVTCKINERTALSSDMFHTLLMQQNITYMKGDWTNRNSEISTFLEKFGRSGVPLYVFYPNSHENGIRSNPVILPQILTPGIVENTLNEAK